MTVVTLLMLEVAVRILYLAPPLNKEWGTRVADPHLPYKHRPLAHYEGRNITDEYDYDYTHNSAGFRDVEPGGRHPKNLGHHPGLEKLVNRGACEEVAFSPDSHFS